MHKLIHKIEEHPGSFRKSIVDSGCARLVCCGVGGAALSGCAWLVCCGVGGAALSGCAWLVCCGVGSAALSGCAWLVCCGVGSAALSLSPGCVWLVCCGVGSAAPVPRYKGFRKAVEVPVLVCQIIHRLPLIFVHLVHGALYLQVMNVSVVGATWIWIFLTKPNLKLIPEFACHLEDLHAQQHISM